MADLIEKVSETEIKVTETKQVLSTKSLTELKRSLTFEQGNLATAKSQYAILVSNLNKKIASIQFQIDEALRLGVKEDNQI